MQIGGKRGDGVQTHLYVDRRATCMGPRAASRMVGIMHRSS